MGAEGMKAIKYSEDQPRVPAGNPDGGQWTDEGGGSGGGGSSRSEDVLNHVDVEDDEGDYRSEAAAGQRWMSRLPNDQRQAIIAYRDKGAFRSINDYLRGGTGSQRARDQAQRIESALATSNVRDGITIWRGMSVHGSVEADQMRDQLRGGHFIDHGFMSGSPSSSIAGNFAVEDSANVTVLFKLMTKNAVGSYIAAPNKEPEYLLQRGAHINVTKTTSYKSGLVYVEGTVGHAD